MDDQSTVCAEWTGKKLFENVDAQVALALAAPTPNRRLAHLANARALLEIISDRARQERKTRWPI